MITPVNQRWRDRRGSYRPAGEPIETRRYEVGRIEDDDTPKAFVIRHHYSGSFPAARFRFGLYRAGQLVGVAVFSHPVNDVTLTKVFPVKATEATELGRLVLLDDVPANGESWFIARCFEELRREVAGIVSFSDPMPRLTAVGELVHPGHVGTVYQATNGVYLGRSKAEIVRLLPDGRVLPRRAIQKLVHRQRGHEYVSRLLRGYGGTGELGDIDRLTRPVRHPGNLKYAWALDRSLRRCLPKSLPYPKLAA